MSSVWIVQVLNSVFIPMLSTHSGKRQQEGGAWAARPATPGRMADLIGNLHKFIGQVSYTRHQLYGNGEGTLVSLALSLSLSLSLF